MGVLFLQHDKYIDSPRKSNELSQNNAVKVSILYYTYKTTLNKWVMRPLEKPLSLSRPTL